MSEPDSNTYICKECNKAFIDCKCIDIIRKSDILMSFLKFDDKFDMRKASKNNRKYFDDNYVKPVKKKKIIKTYMKSVEKKN